MTTETVLEMRANLREMDRKSKASGEPHPKMTPEREGLVKRLCKEEYSSSPLWKARVEKNPDFWKTFSPGRIR